MNLGVYRSRLRPFDFVKMGVILVIGLFSTSGCSKNSPFQLHEASAKRELESLAKDHFERRGLFKEGDFFTRLDRRGDEDGKVYQLKNVRIRCGAGFSYLTKADKLNGIDLRTTVILFADGFREKTPIGEWSDWRSGVGPISQLGLTAERRNGVFSFGVSTNAGFFRPPSPSDTW